MQINKSIKHPQTRPRQLHLHLDPESLVWLCHMRRNSMSLRQIEDKVDSRTQDQNQLALTVNISSSLSSRTSWKKHRLDGIDHQWSDIQWYAAVSQPGLSVNCLRSFAFKRNSSLRLSQIWIKQRIAGEALMRRRIPAADTNEAVQLMGRYWDKWGGTCWNLIGTSLHLNSQPSEYMGVLCFSSRAKPLMPPCILPYSTRHQILIMLKVESYKIVSGKRM